LTPRSWAAGASASPATSAARAGFRSRTLASLGTHCRRCLTARFQISFKVLYGNTSFAIIEDYTPNPDAAVLGAYNKTVEEPFGKLLRLPTVFVNVTDDGQGGAYDFAIMCAQACAGQTLGKV
jgi:hypothetical protein